MSLSRRNPRRDTVEPAIVEALQALGWTITRVSGKGAPDILARRQGHASGLPSGLCFGFEIKAEKGRRTKAQQESQWPILRSVDDALQAVGARS